MDQQSMMSQNGQQPQSSLLIELEGPLNDQQALQILVDAVSVANLRGAFAILESGNVSAAVKHFTRKRPPQPAADLKEIAPEAKAKSPADIPGPNN